MNQSKAMRLTNIQACSYEMSITSTGELSENWEDVMILLGSLPEGPQAIGTYALSGDVNDLYRAADLVVKRFGLDSKDDLDNARLDVYAVVNGQPNLKSNDPRLNDLVMKWHSHYLFKLSRL